MEKRGRFYKPKLTKTFAYLPLTRGLNAKIDLEDVPLIIKKGTNWFWDNKYPATHTRTNKKYPNGNWKYKKVRLHRFLVNAPDSLYVDHINGDRLDNRRKNLRICTIAQSNQNRSMRRDNTSGYKGVSWSKAMSKWSAYINASGHHIGLGYYSSPKEAAKAYDAKARELYGEFAKTNLDLVRHLRVLSDS